MTAQPQAANPAVAYETHLVPAMFRPWVPELLRRGTPQRGDHVLDVACGTGVVAREVSPLVGKEGSVTGFDISQAMLDVAASFPQPAGAAIHWRQGNAEELPFDDGSFDVVLCQQGLQFMPGKLTAVREMRRVLKPRGKAGVSLWRDPELQRGFAVMDDAFARHLGQVPDAPFSMGDASEIRSLFRDAGFGDVQIEAVKRDVHFPSAEGFVRLIFMSAAAAVPEFMGLDETAREQKIEAVDNEASEVLRPYRDGGGLTFAMESHLVVATP